MQCHYRQHAGRSRSADARRAPGAAAGQRTRCWSRSPRRGSTAPTSSSAAASIRRRPARPTSSASKSPARWSRRGEGAEGLLGRKVCALVAGGGYAEYCVAPAGTCLIVPEVLRLTEAAAMPETLFTVWVNLFERGFAADGDAVLVHGGTSGIGTMAILLGKLFGLEVIVTCGSDEKCARALEIGAAHAINYQTEDFVAEVKRLTGDKGVAVVLDMVGGDYVARNLACLAEDGRHVSIAIQRGTSAEIPIVDIMRRRLTLTGSTLRPRSLEFKTMVADEIAAHRLALCRGRAVEAGDRQRLPARRRRRGACADGSGRPCRQDRARNGGMSERLILHEYAASGNCYKVRLTAAHVGVALERREYDIMKGETRTPEFLAEGRRQRRIPVLQVGDRFLPESNAACFYLAERLAADPVRPLRSRRHASLDVLGAISSRAQHRDAALLAAPCRARCADRGAAPADRAQAPGGDRRAGADGPPSGRPQLVRRRPYDASPTSACSLTPMSPTRPISTSSSIRR